MKKIKSGGRAQNRAVRRCGSGRRRRSSGPKPPCQVFTEQGIEWAKLAKGSVRHMYRYVLLVLVRFLGEETLPLQMMCDNIAGRCMCHTQPHATGGGQGSPSVVT